MHQLGPSRHWSEPRHACFAIRFKIRVRGLSDHLPSLPDCQIAPAQLSNRLIELLQILR